MKYFPVFQSSIFQFPDKMCIKSNDSITDHYKIRQRILVFTFVLAILVFICVLNQSYINITVMYKDWLYSLRYNKSNNILIFNKNVLIDRPTFWHAALKEYTYKNYTKVFFFFFFCSTTIVDQSLPVPFVELGFSDIWVTPP